MSGITLNVKTIPRIIFGFIFMFSASIILYAHITPGGGFAGGLMFACGFILLMLAFGKKEAFGIIREKALEAWDCIGSLGFLGIALLGFFGGVFFMDFIPRGAPLRLISGGTIMWSNIFIGIKVSAGISALFTVLVMFRLKK